MFKSKKQKELEAIQDHLFVEMEKSIGNEDTTVFRYLGKSIIDVQRDLMKEHERQMALPVWKMIIGR